MPEVRVRLGERSYPVVVTSSRPDILVKQLKKALRTERLFVFYDANVYALHSRTLRPLLRGSGAELVEFVIPSGEKSKSSAVLSRVYDHLILERIRRHDFILVCGGGVASDVVGYAAATILRGVAWGVVPTTLLSMVDAAIGGKTGINHEAGKNLVGAFWQPSFVFCDTAFLATLPLRQLVAGLGEIAKYGGLCGGEMLKSLQVGVSDDSLFASKRLSGLILRSARYKAAVVGRDERDRGYRLRLNLGHTFAHAIENAVDYKRLLHGEAVLLGLLAAVELSALTRPRNARALLPYRELLVRLVGLVPRVKIPRANVLGAMACDKKRSRKGSAFVLLETAGKVYVADTITDKLVCEAFDKMLSFYNPKGGADATHSGC